MIIRGRDKPIASVHMDETGVLHLRIDFRLYLPGWVELTIQNEDLERLQRGEEIYVEEGSNV
jgi:hypothetical protein